MAWQRELHLVGQHPEPPERINSTWTYGYEQLFAQERHGYRTTSMSEADQENTLPTRRACQTEVDLQKWTVLSDPVCKTVRKHDCRSTLVCQKSFSTAVFVDHIIPLLRKHDSRSTSVCETPFVLGDAKSSLSQ